MKMLKTSFKYYIVSRVLCAFTAILLFAALAIWSWPSETNSSISYKDIQGLGYSQNGKALYLATDSGIYTYKKNGFSTINKDMKHYYGFNVTAQGIYTSGIELNDAKTPIGIIRSTDKGVSFKEVVLKGETYFQGLTIGYNTDTMFVYNANGNSQMSETGIYLSENNAETWEKIEGDGLDGNIVSIKAHPIEKTTLVVVTSTGAYLSQNNGDSFTSLSSEDNISAIHLNVSNQLIYSTGGEKTEIKKMDIKSKKTTKITAPPSIANSIDFIEANPQNDNTITIATASDDIFTTYNNGSNWEKINK